MLLQKADNFLLNLDYVMWSLARALGMTMDSHCDLETIDDETTFVGKDGSLGTLIRINGILQMVGASEFNQLTDALSASLGAYLNSGHHTFHCVFVRDPDRRAVHRLVSRALQGARETMRRLGLDFEDILRRNEAVLSHQYCALEQHYLMLWTHPKSLSPIEQKQATTERARLTANTPAGGFSQRAIPAARALRETHRSFVDSLLNDFADLDYSVDKLPVADALRASRSMLDPENTDNDWRPSLPGDPLPQRINNDAVCDDYSAVLWPSLSAQLFPDGAQLQDLKHVALGNRHYAPLSMHLGPQRLQPFNTLHRRLINDNIPYALSIRIISDGEGLVAHKRLLASLLSFADRTSRMVRRSLETLAMQVESGVQVTGLQVNCMTWVSDGDREELARRTSRLDRAIQGWGSCETRRNDGNPIRSINACAPGVLIGSPANMMAAPVSDVVRMLPVSRPTSPWVNGAMLLRTPDGKLFPYEPFSSKQTAWVTLVYAPMGWGKSVKLNALNFSLCLSAGLERLPRIGILDIGPSSSGIISLLKEALPPDRRHEAQSIRLRLTKDYQINPCDTLLGCRYPASFQQPFLVNLLTLFATPLDGVPHESVAGIANMVVHEVYRQCADDGSPKRYDQSVCPVVDEAIADHQIKTDDRTTWWEVVDALFDAGDLHHAMIAQRYAAPTISDCAAMAKDEKITSIYKGDLPGSNIPVTDYFWRSVGDAVRNYAILSGPTEFSLGDARVVSLDLEEVATRGGPQAMRQTAVMYMLARHILANDIFLRKDHLTEIPERYRDHHAREIERSESDPKRLCFDEFHRTEAAAQVRGQIETDIRESRKWKVEFVLASQKLSDFTETMVEMATTVFIMGAGNRTLEATASTFNLPDAARYALAKLPKPGQAGSHLIAWFDAGGGKFVHRLTLTLAPELIWAFSTTREDVSIRQKLYEQLPPAAARATLARVYPAGTAKPEVERRKAAMAERGEYATEAALTSLIDNMVVELVEASHSIRDAEELVSG